MTGAALPVLVAAALPEELAAVARRLSGATAVPSAGGRARRGRLGGREVVLALAGDGAARAGRDLRRILAAVPCCAVVGVGVAGGLSDDLRAGDVVAGVRVRDGGSFVAFADPELVRAALAAGARGGTLLTAPAVALTADDKRALASTLAPGCAVVDLESSAWAAEAARLGLPWVVLRAVSDSRDEDLPGILRGCVGSDGTVGRRRVAAAALARPAALPALLGLARRVRRASERLAAVLEGMMEGSAPGETGTAAQEAV